MDKLISKTMIEFLHFANPTTEQTVVLKELQEFVQEKTELDFMVVCGSAGTGKSSIMNAVVKWCQQTKIKVEICAPTARAARLIAQKSNDIASTIHSMIFNVNTKKDEAPVHFSLKLKTEEDYTIYIIDEASMINSKVKHNHEDELFICNHAILDAIASFIKTANCKNKVIFVGDRFQLAPVGEIDSNALYPEYLRKQFNWNGAEHYLTEVKRQENGSYILENATEIRNSIEKSAPLPCIRAENANNSFAAMRLYVNDLLTYGPNYVTAIACTSKQNRHFNLGVRTLRFGSSLHPIAKNDVLTVKRNWKRKGVHLFNGDTVIVKDVEYTCKECVAGIYYVPILLRVKDNFNQEIEIADYLMLDCLEYGQSSLGIEKENKLYRERYVKNKTYQETGNIEDDRYLGAIRASYGYSITCNAAQGGEWNKVYLNTFHIPNSRWAYTGVTRAKEKLVKF